MEKAHKLEHKGNKNGVSRITVSLSPNLLQQFDTSMLEAGFSDRSKAIQSALHTFINENSWKKTENQSGAGTIVLLYDNHAYNQDKESIPLQHQYSDIICASTHIHLENDNCLETILIKGKIKRIKELLKIMSQNRGIKSLKLNFMTLV